MENNYKKELAFVCGLILKIITDEPIGFNEMQSLQNIMSDLDCHELEEDEFRW